MPLALPPGLTASVAAQVQNDPTMIVRLTQGGAAPVNVYDWEELSISRDNLGSAGSVDANLLDAVGAVETEVLAEIDGGFGPDSVAVFRGELFSASRSSKQAIEGASVNVSMIGRTARVLDMVVDTVYYRPGEPGVGGWHDTAFGAGSPWTRSQIADDIARRYFPTFPRSITVSTLASVQKPFIQASVADILDRISQPEFAFWRFDETGTFVWRPVPEAVPAVPDHSFTEGTNLHDFSRAFDRGEMVNQVLVRGQGTQTLRVVYPTEILATQRFSAPPGQTTTQSINIPQAAVSPELSHAHVVTIPTFTPIQRTVTFTITLATSTPPFTLPLTGADGTPLTVVDNFSMTQLVFQSKNPAAPNEGMFSTVVTFEGGGTQTFCPNNDCRSCVPGVGRCPGPFTWVGAGTPIMATPWNAPNPVTQVQVHATGTGLGTVYTLQAIYTYRQRGDASPPASITVNRRQLPAQPTQPTLPPTNPTVPFNLSTVYPVDIVSTFPTTNVQVDVTVTGRAVSDLVLPVIFWTARDATAIGTHGERNWQFTSESITTQAEAQAIATRLLAAGGQRLFRWTWGTRFNPAVQPGDSARLAFTDPNLTAKFGAQTPILFVLSVRHRATRKPGQPVKIVTELEGIPWTQNAIALAKALRDNPIKERASAQAEFLTGEHQVAITGIDVVSPLVPGQPDRQRYRVRFQTATNLVINDVPNSNDAPYRIGQMAVAIFRNGLRDQPWLIGPASNVLNDGSVLVQ